MNIKELKKGMYLSFKGAKCNTVKISCIGKSQSGSYYYVLEYPDGSVTLKNRHEIGRDWEVHVPELKVGGKCKFVTTQNIADVIGLDGEFAWIRTEAGPITVYRSQCIPL